MFIHKKNLLKSKEDMPPDELVDRKMLSGNDSTFSFKHELEGSNKVVVFCRCP